MTTVVWDGKTLSVDSRVTYLQDGKQIGQEDTADKLVFSDKIMFQNEPVQVVAISGDMRANKILRLCANHPEIAPFDLANTGCYGADGAFHDAGDFAFTIITPTHGGFVTKVGGQVTINKQARREFIAAGSRSKQAAAHAILGFKSDQIVGMAMLTDKMTGGEIRTWDPVTGLVKSRSWGGWWANYRNCLKTLPVALYYIVKTLIVRVIGK